MRPNSSSKKENHVGGYIRICAFAKVSSQSWDFFAAILVHVEPFIENIHFATGNVESIDWFTVPVMESDVEPPDFECSYIFFRVCGQYFLQSVIDCFEEMISVVSRCSVCWGFIHTAAISLMLHMEYCNEKVRLVLLIQFFQFLSEICHIHWRNSFLYYVSNKE